MKSASPPNHGLSEGKEYSLKLGTSFERGSRAQESFHVLRYDFKPASIDTSQPAELTFGSNKECVVTYPNQDQGSTTFKGGRKPGAKECILIIDKETGDITLERVSSTIPLKKSRSGTVDRSVDRKEVRKTNNTPVTTTLPHKKATSHSSKHNKSHDSSSTSATSGQPQHDSSQASSGNSSGQNKLNAGQQHTKQPPVQKPQAPPKDTSGSSSSDSSSDSDSSDSDSDVEEHAKTLDQFNDISTPYDPPPPASTNTHEANKGSNILQDLQLSDSNSDSDSD